MDNRKKPDILVISTQVPLKKLNRSVNYRQGKTGQILQRITGCDMHIMSEDPVDDKQKAILKRRINPNSWVIITGHGKEGGGFDALEGATNQYKIDTQFLFEDTLPIIVNKYQLERYVEILTEQGNLKSGDHINLVLFVCQAGRESKDSAKKSFAEKMGKALAEKGITSSIIATASNITRVKDPSVREVKITNKKEDDFIPKPPFVFMTNKNGNTMKYQAPGDITLTKDGINQSHVSDLRKKYNQSYLVETDFHRNVDQLYEALEKTMKSRWQDKKDYDKNSISFIKFIRDKKEILNSLSENSLVRFAISVSETNPDCYRFSYFEDGMVHHRLFKLTECDMMLKLIDKKDLWYRPPMSSGYVNIYESPSPELSRPAEYNSNQTSPSTSRIDMFSDTTSGEHSDSRLKNTSDENKSSPKKAR